MIQYFPRPTVIITEPEDTVLLNTRRKYTYRMGNLKVMYGIHSVCLNKILRIPL